MSKYNLPESSGIYQIRSKINPHKMYVGSAVNLEKRRWCHIYMLRNGSHKNKKLQNHFNKYGEADLLFSVIIGCNKNDLIKQEQYFIDALSPQFNICMKAGNTLGRYFSEETKNKMSKSHKGAKATDETKKRMSIARKGEKNPMFGSCRKGELNPRYKAKVSEETRLKISQANKGRTDSEEARIKKSKSHSGMRLSKIHSENIKKGVQLWWDNKRKELAHEQQV